MSIIRFAGYTLVALCIVTLYFYFFLGLKYFINAFTEINKLPTNEKAKAMNIFFEGSTKNGSYSGTLAKVNYSKNYSTIYVWGKEGLKSFTLGSGSSFSRFSMCQDDAWKKAYVNISKLKNLTAYDWSKIAKVGDYVTLSPLANNNHEATVYDWWVFIPLSLDKLEFTCTNR